MTKEVHPLYRTSKWKKTRERSFRKHQYLCQESLRYGIRRQAETGHHIYPIEQYPELAFEQWNILPVTNKKHNTFHNRITNEITEKGRYWQEKRKEEFGKFHNPPHLEKM